MFERIAGHKKQIGLLQKSIETGRIAHAYIFSGPSFVGKRTLALLFAQALLGKDQTDAEFFHPDFLEVSASDSIKIEQVRELIYKLSLKPYQAKYKVAVIDNAENMTDQAQNGLLKLLEEPKEYTVIILVTANADKLLHTISSRAQRINFGLVRKADYENLLPAKIDSETKDLITTFSAGRPGLALVSSQEEFLEELQATNRYYAIMSSADLVDKLKLAYELADLETADLKRVLEFWQIKYEAELNNDASMKSAQDLNLISLARRYLDQNINSKLLLTNLMLGLK